MKPTRRDTLKLLASPALVTAAAAAQTARRDRHVIVISIDGFSAYSLHDKTLPLPVIRKLGRDGAMADGMEPVNPSVTWPNHTSMVTGVTPARHGVLYNGLPVRPGPGKALRVEPWVDKTLLVQAPTVYDAAHAAGLTTAEVNWVAIQNAPSITWAFPERPKVTEPVAKEMMAAGLVTEAEIQDFAKAGIVWRDEVWTMAGEHIIEKHKPNLLLFHWLTTDSSQHRYGARSLGGYAALTLADAKVERLLAAARRAGIADRTTVIIVSDHGFKTYTEVIHPNALLRQKGLVRDAGEAVDCDAWTVPEGGTANVYITRDEKKAELIPMLRTAFAAVPGIKQVIGSEGVAQLGYPVPEKTERMCDLVLAAADGYAFDGAHRGETVTKVPAGASPGAHGYLSTDRDMDCAFVASGAGIRKGVNAGRIRNLDVAATVARLLGIEMKGIDGRVLSEILG